MSTEGMNWADKLYTINQARALYGPERWDSYVADFDLEKKLSLAEHLISRRHDWLAEKITQRTEERYIDEKALSQARRKVAAESFVGTEVLTWEDMEDAQQAYLVEDLVPERSVVFLVAKRNIGKTFLYIDMVCSMALGLKWLGKETKQTKVMLVLGEGVHGYIARLRSWCDMNGQDFEELKKWLVPVNGANLSNDTSVETLREHANAEEVELIVFDTWANTSGGADENDAAGNSEVLQTAVSIRPEATVFFVHHPRKSDQDSSSPVMRGSSVLDGRADVVLTMFRDPGFTPTGSEKPDKADGWLAISTEDHHAGKNRSAQTETIQGLYLAEHGSSAVMRQASGASLSKVEKTLRRHLSGVMTAKEYAGASRLSDRTARDHLKEAEASGFVELVSAAKGTIPASYRLAPIPEVNVSALVRASARAKK